MQQLREQYLRKGYVFLPQGLNEKVVDHFKRIVQVAVKERSYALMKLPRTFDIATGSATKKDPLGEMVANRFRQLKQQRAKEKIDRRKKRGLAPLKPKKSQASGDDVWDMAQKIAKQLAVPTDPSEAGRSESLREDPELMKAIDACRVNTWMTNEDIETFLKGPIASLIGPSLRAVAGIDNPVLFSDKPHFRQGYYRPLLPEFVAPQIGVGAESFLEQTGCGVWIFGDECTPMRCPLFGFPGEESLEHASEQYPRIPMKVFDMDFIPAEAHLQKWIREFPLIHNSVAESLQGVKPGTVMLYHPFFFVGMGVNFSAHPHTSMQLSFVNQASIPSRAPPTWIRRWQTRSSGIDYADERIFPKF